MEATEPIPSFLPVRFSSIFTINNYQVSPVSRTASVNINTTLVRLSALLRLSSTLPNPFPTPFPFPSPLLLSFPSPFPSCVRPRVSTPSPSPFPFCVRPRVSTPVPVPIPVSILRPFARLHPRLHSVSVPSNAHIPVPAPDPVRSFPSLGPGYPLDTMRVCRHQALRTELSGVRKRHPLSAEMNESARCKPKENRRQRRATSIRSARFWDSLECIADLCPDRLMANSLMCSSH